MGKKGTFKLRGIPIKDDNPIRGNSYHVCNATAVSTDQTGVDDSTSYGTISKPFSTIDYAINQCSANQGDIIHVLQNHAETLSAASAIALDTAGIKLVGHGHGEDRPTITLDNTAATVAMSGANCSIENFVFKCGVDQLVTIIQTTADDVLIKDCEFREGSALQALNFITVGVADNDSDRFRIEDCIFYAPTAGDANEAINVAADMDSGIIEGNTFYGDWDEAGIQIPAGGNAQVNLTIRDNVITNLLTGQHAIQINGTGSTGKVVDNKVETDAYATSIDAGGLEMFGNKYNDGTDQGGSIDLPTKVGEQSIVLKSTGDLTSSGTSVSLFTVTGDVLCKVGGTVDVALTCTSGTSTAEVGVAGNTAALCVQDAIDATAFDIGDSWSLITAADANAAQMADEWVLIGNGVDIIMTVSVDDITAGDIDFYCQYIPLTPGSSVVAA